LLVGGLLFSNQTQVIFFSPPRDRPATADRGSHLPKGQTFPSYDRSPIFLSLFWCSQGVPSLSLGSLRQVEPARPRSPPLFSQGRRGRVAPLPSCHAQRLPLTVFPVVSTFFFDGHRVALFSGLSGLPKVMEDLFLFPPHLPDRLSFLFGANSFFLHRGGDGLRRRVQALR